MNALDIIGVSGPEKGAHLDFFGKMPNLDAFRCLLGQTDPETFCEWLRLGLEPHFLPNIDMVNGGDYAEFPGWKVTPGQWFLKIATNGSFSYPAPAREDCFPLSPSELGGQIVLIDTRAKPMLAEPDQVFERDNLLGPIIWKLRKKGSLALHPGQRVFSRFGISPEEWKEVASALADRLGVEDEQVRQERIVEANVIPQLYPGMPRSKDFGTDSYVMVEEHSDKGAKRLSMGGDSGKIGTSFVPLGAEEHWLFCAVRPIIVLGEV